MQRLPTLLLMLVIITACSQKSGNAISITEVTPAQLQTGYLVDVRTPEEYDLGHLDGAVNIDWFAPDFADRFQDIPKDRTIYVYCKKGGRSAKAQEKLRSLGYDHVVDLKGGYEAWEAAQ